METVLTERERIIVQEVIDGKTTPEIEVYTIDLTQSVAAIVTSRNGNIETTGENDEIPW